MLKHNRHGFRLTFKEVGNDQRRIFCKRQMAIFRNIVIERQGGQCIECGRDITQIHHNEYPKRWEDDDPDNLVGLCGQCHMLRHNINIAKCDRVSQAIWDYVLVEVRKKKRSLCPVREEECQFEPSAKCKTPNSYCEYYHGEITLDDVDYVICDNREVEE